MSIKKKIVMGTAAVVIGLGGFTVAPTMIAAPESPMVQSAEAATWVPQTPPRKQPIGWGNVCLWSKHYSYGSYQYTTEYRWYTTSLTGSKCYVYRTYR